ncbi:sugar kinase [Phaeacidiphilus oryzae]|uniref:sugar kinase n=1 Tax=Phaeacidiphilus oryzae TaxID=348818 RepID=UPI000A4B3F10|nr:sugar kinase [Phaeacidiphilus oryzae]
MTEQSQRGEEAGSPPDLVLCVGESMVLLVTPAGTRLARARGVELRVAGAESTVARYLADLGQPAAWASRVGADPLGERVVADIAAAGVDVRYVERDPAAPTGVYFKDPAPDGTRVYYYRSGSAAARIDPAFVERLAPALAGARMIHLSGVTPALSAECAAASTALFARARDAGALCSFDVNHRPPLWSPAEAAGPLLELARRADLVFVGLDEAQRVWGGRLRSAADVRGLIGGGTLVVKDAEVGATLFEPDEPAVFVPAPPVEVVEPVGAGDAFAAGVLAARLRGLPAPEQLALGHRVAALALRSTGDHADASALRPGQERQGAR